MMNEKIVIIGAGQAGGRAALGLRKAGFSGGIDLLGDEPHPPYQRPPLSKAVLLGKKPFEKTYLASIESFNENNINLKTNLAAENIDTSNQVVSAQTGERFDYQHLILATGSIPRQLTIKGCELDGISTFRTLSDVSWLAPRLKENTRLVIVGGGFIGLEIASSAIELGCQVTVLEAQAELLSRSLPKSAARDIESIHESFGVTIRKNININEFAGEKGQLKSVVFVDGTSIDADVVLIGIGIVPQTRLAEQAGLIVNNGIICDQFCRTTKDNIYAIGDCASSFIPRYDKHIRLESSQNADLQAITVCNTISGNLVAYDPVPWLWSQQCNWIIQTAGFTDLGDNIVCRGDVREGMVVYFAIANNRICGVIGIGKGAAVAKEVRFSQMLIEKNISVDENDLINRDVELRSLL